MIATAEQAAQSRIIHGKTTTTEQMVRAVAEIRQDPALSPYLSHPEIIQGILQGKFGANGLRRYVEEMALADV